MEAPYPPRDPATSLDALPDELLLFIIEKIDYWEHPRPRLPSLLGLSLVNRRCNRLAQKYLYRVFKSDSSDPLLFLLQLDSRPEVRVCVEEIHYNHQHPPGSTMQPTGIPIWDAQKDDFTITAMLRHTPNIKTFRVDMVVPVTIGNYGDFEEEGEQGPGSFLWMKALALAGSPSRSCKYQKLHTITASQVHLGPLSIVLRLPSLRTLKLHHCFDSWTDWPWKCQPGESKLNEIILGNCQIDSRILVLLLRSCDDLRAFGYSPSSPEHAVDYIPVDFSRLGAGLRSYTLRSLEKLKIDTKAHVQGEPMRVLGSLRDFEKLSHLDIPFDSLVPNEMDKLATISHLLPPSLNRLDLYVHVDWESPAFESVMTELASSFRERLPNLKTLWPEVAMEGSIPTFADYKKIRALFNGGGVEFPEIALFDNDHDWESSDEDYEDYYEQRDDEDHEE